MLSYSRILEVLNKNNLVIKSKDINNCNIEHISYDSRDIKENTLFFCKGIHYKQEYLFDSIKKGTICYVSEKEYDIENVSYIIVTDVRRAMAVISLEFYDYSFKKLKTIGITGTKGKTTVAYFLRNILNEYTKSRIGFISTVDTYTGITDEQSHLTTPEPIELNRFFYETVQSNIEYLVMEVTSQSYKTERIYGVNFDYGMFLNISEDHISDAEHPNFDDYLNCKLEILKLCKTVVVNKNTDKLNLVLDACKDKKIILYGTDNTADYYYNNVKKLDNGFSFDVINNGNTKKFTISMQGRFNIENALAAIVQAKVLGVDDESIQKGLEETSVMGRMNVYDKDGITVVVDYAHNALSFTRLYESLKLDYPNRRIISLGGGPGGKAYARRKDFGVIVGGNSDYCYLTAEDPQYEEVKDICRDIGTYIDKDKYEVIEDRTEAIETAIKNAKKGDVIVLLAKGEELYQKVKGVFVPYESDLLIVKRLFDDKINKK